MRREHTAQGLPAAGAMVLPEPEPEDAVLLIRGCGTVWCLYTDSIPLAALGRLQIRRASTVEFDNGRQGWTVTFPDGGRLEGFATRAAALQAERGVVNRWLLAGRGRSCRSSAAPGGHALTHQRSS